MAIAIVEYRAAGSKASDPGLLGLAQIRLGGLILIKCVAVRRTREGRVYLSFPSRELRTGERRHVVRPVDAASRRWIEEQVIAQLRERGVLP